MRRTLAWIVLMLATGFGLQAQTRWTLEPHAGLTLYQFIGDEANGCRMRPGLAIGAHTRWRLVDYMSLSAGVEYIPRGSRLKHMDGHLRQDHLSFPVLVQFHPFGEQLSLGIGVCPTVSVHSRLVVTGEQWNSRDLFHAHDFMIPIGVTYRLPCGVCIGARMAAGRKTMVRRDATFQGTRYNLRGAMVNNNEITVTVGYQIGLK